MTDHFSPSLKLNHKSHLIKLNGNWMTLIMQKIKMKDAFSQSLTTRNDTIWPMWQIREEAAGRCYLPLWYHQQKSYHGKNPLPLPAVGQGSTNTSVHEQEVLEFDLGEVLMKDQEKQSQRPRYSGARLGFFEASKVTHVLHIYHITSICSIWWERHKDAAPQSSGGEDTPTRHYHIVSAEPEVCVRCCEILEENTNQWLQEKFKKFTKAAAWESSFENWEVPKEMQAILESGEGMCALSRGCGWLVWRKNSRDDGKQGWGSRLSGPHPRQGENGSLKAGQWYGLICFLGRSSWKQYCKRPGNWEKGAQRRRQEREVAWEKDNQGTGGRRTMWEWSPWPRGDRTFNDFTVFPDPGDDTGTPQWRLLMLRYETNEYFGIQYCKMYITWPNSKVSLLLPQTFKALILTCLSICSLIVLVF